MEGASPACRKMRLAGLVFFVLISVWLVLVYLQSVLLPNGIIHYVESALELKISGKVRPLWGKFEFSIDPLQALWDQKIRIDSGGVQVSYGLQKLLFGELHVVLTGKDVAAELLGDWASVAGGHSAVFKDLYADLIIDHDGIKEIRALRAESPALQFRFGEASNRHLKETHEA